MYSCEVCDYWTYLAYQLEEHTEENHPVCNSCERIFRTHNGLRKHYLDSQYHNYCGICERDFHSQAALRGHQERHHNYCGICERDFVSQAALRGHQEIHQPRDIKCPRCDRGFPSASAMAKHVRHHIVFCVSIASFVSSFVFLNVATVQCLRAMYLRSYMVVVFLGWIE